MGKCYFVLCVCPCTLSHTVKRISHYISGWEENEKPQKQKETNYFLQDMLSLSKKGLGLIK